MGQTLKTSLFSDEIVTATSKLNKDKVIHHDLKEVEFDDIVLSVVHVESDKLKNSIISNSETLTQLTEHEVTEAAQPVMTDQLLRVSFWDEVNTALVENRTISERNIWKGVCSNTYWNKVRDELPAKMAYVLTPLISYSKGQKLALQLGQKAMLNILAANPKQGDKFDTKLAQLQHQIYQANLDRAFGKAVQRIQSHNTNETVTPAESIEELQKEIARLEGKSVIEIPNE